MRVGRAKTLSRGGGEIDLCFLLINAIKGAIRYSYAITVNISDFFPCSVEYSEHKIHENCRSVTFYFMKKIHILILAGSAFLTNIMIKLRKKLHVNSQALFLYIHICICINICMIYPSHLDDQN